MTWFCRRGSRPATDLAEPTLQPSNTMQPVLHLQAQGVVLTSYFVGSTDPIYQSNPGRHKVGDFGYMDLWYAAHKAFLSRISIHHGRPDQVISSQEVGVQVQDSSGTGSASSGLSQWT